MKYIIIFLIIPTIFFGQNEIATFSFENDYNIQPHLSFSNKNKNFLICSNLINDYEENLVKGKLHILKFDKEFIYIGRYVVGFKDIDPKNVSVKSIKKLENNKVELTFLNKKLDGYDMYSGELNLNTFQVNNQKLKYSITFPKKVPQRFIRALTHNNKTVFLCLNTKAKELIVYKLNENDFKTFKFSLEKTFYRWFKYNFNEFENSALSTEFLDRSIGFQYHFYKDNLFLISAFCNKGTMSFNSSIYYDNCSTGNLTFPLHIVKIDLETGDIDMNLISNEIRSSIAFNILEDQLFYTYAEDQNISVNKVDLNDFYKDTLRINESKLKRADLSFKYSNYNLKSEKIKRETIEYTKFYKKFESFTSLFVQKNNDSTYNFNLGSVRYKAYNNFGDWLGTFATGTVLGGLSSFASNNHFSIYSFRSSNEIPKIYNILFSVNQTFTKISKHSNQKVNNQRVHILNNLKYFIKKGLVAPLNSPNIGEPSIMLYRHKSNSKKFYIYKFPN